MTEIRDATKCLDGTVDVVNDGRNLDSAYFSRWYGIARGTLSFFEGGGFVIERFAVDDVHRRNCNLSAHSALKTTYIPRLKSWCEVPRAQ